MWLSLAEAVDWGWLECIQVPLALLGLGLDTLGKLGVWRRQPLSILQLPLPRCMLLTEITPPALFGEAAEGPFLGTHGACTAVGLFFLT